MDSKINGFEFQNIECSSSNEFMSRLNPQNKLWTQTNPMRSYIFRGQANASWELKPSAWRGISFNEDSAFELAKSNIDEFLRNGGDIRTISEFHHDEKIRNNLFHLIKFMNHHLDKILQFVFLSNRIGMHAPSFSEIIKLRQDFKNYYIKRLIERFAGVREPNNIWESDAVALAQHHGMATPLLDWTYNAKKAAYFAILNPEDIGDNIAIFALSTTKIFEHKSFTILNVTTSQNDFLRVQEGLFTYDSNGDIFFLHNGKYPTLQESIADYPVHGYKFILPKSETQELKEHLMAEGIHEASLMPTYDNVAKMINESNWTE